MFKRKLVCFTLLLSTVLMGCASSGNIARLSQKAVEPAPASASLVGAQQIQLPMTDAWWTPFEDDVLDRLISQALTGNFSLHSAQARVERASAMAGQPGGGLLPAMSNIGLLGDRFEASAELWGYSSRIAMSYEVDLWDKFLPGTLPKNLQVSASKAELSASVITLSANVANTYFALVKSQEELRLLEHQSAINKEVLALVTENAHGTLQPDELLRQRQLVAESETQRIRVEAGQRLLTHQLAALVGASASEFTLPEDLPSLTMLPALPYTGVPAEWLLRRPDLQASFLRIRSLDPDIAQMVASFFPRVNLSSLVSPAHLLEDWLLGLASKLSLPLLDRANVAFEVDLAEAKQAEALADYRHKVMTAVQEVEDAMVAEERDRSLARSLGQRLALAQGAFGHLKHRYAEGEVEYFEVFTTLRDMQLLERERLAAKLALSLDRVAIARALAGSWNQPQNNVIEMLRSAALSAPSTGPLYDAGDILMGEGEPG